MWPGGVVIRAGFFSVSGRRTLAASEGSETFFGGDRLFLEGGGAFGGNESS